MRLAPQHAEGQDITRGGRPFYRGKPINIDGEIVYEHEYSDRLLERLLEANDPEKFKRRIENTNLLDLDPAKLTTAQLEVLAGYLFYG